MKELTESYENQIKVLEKELS